MLAPADYIRAVKATVAAIAKAGLVDGGKRQNRLGRKVDEAALAAGERVIAGARRTEELAPLSTRHPPFLFRALRLMRVRRWFSQSLALG